MSSIPVADLSQLMTPEEDLECAEYCFKLYVDFTMRPMNVYNLKRLLTALLNTSGGFISIYSYGDSRVDDATIDNWKRDLEGQLAVFIARDIYMSCITLIGNSMPLLMKVSQSPKLITLSSNLFVRQMAGNNTLYDSSEIQKLIASESSSRYQHPLSEVTSLEYGTPINVRESQAVEFKCWRRVRTMHDYKGRIYVERIRRSFFSLSNLPTGGDLILGVEEDEKTKMNTIHGQMIKEQDEATLTEFIGEFLRQDSSSVKRIWGSEDMAPELGKHWNIEFIPVLNCPKGERRRIIRIHFYHCKGGVFEHPPESYCVSQEGLVMRMSFQEWVTTINNRTLGTPNESFVTETQISGRARTESHSMGGNMRRQPYYRWSKNSRNWARNITISTLDHHQNVIQLAKQQGTLKAANPFTFTPSRGTLPLSCIYKRELKEALDDIETMVCYEAAGFAIASSQWHANISHNITIDRPEGHIMDILLMDDQCNTHLFCIVDPIFPTNRLHHIWRYAVTSARITKRNLLLCGGHQDFHTNGNPLELQIKCYVYKLSTGILKSTLTRFLQLEMAKHMEVFPVLQKRLAAVLLQKKTYIKNLLGQESGVHLTANQMEKILMSDFDRFNFVEGPPGSGKTYLALYLCSKYDNKKVAYICTTVPFESFLLYQGCCHPVLVQNEPDLLQHINNRRLAPFDCIIIDDVHNLKCSDETWTALFKFVLHTPNIHLFIFADSRYQSFKAPTSMPSLKQQLQRFCDSINIPYHVKTLNVVHRNTQKIVSFIKACFEDDEHYPDHERIRCSHPDVGDDVEIRKMDNLYSESIDNSLVEYISSITKPGDLMDGCTTSYQPTDIAVLVDTETPVEDINRLMRILQNHLEGITVHTAGVFPVRGLTIDTLDNFLGFDRPLCIFVTSNETIYNMRCTGRSIANPLYKAFVASRAVSKIVFAVPVIDVPMAMRWKLDKVYYKASRMGWMQFPDTIREFAFIKTNHLPDLMCVTCNQDTADVKIYLMSTQLQELPLSMDIISVSEQRPRLFVSSKCYEYLFVVHDGANGVVTWSVFKSFGLKKQHTHTIGGEPKTACWTPANEIVMTILKDEKYLLRKYWPDGSLVWESDQEATKLVKPQSMACNTSGCFYILDGEKSIKVISPSGHYIQCITDGNPEDEQLVEPMSILIDTTDAWLAVSQRCSKSGKRVVVILSTEGKQIRCMLQPEDSCYEICMYRTKYMAVATGKGLRLYDVDGFY